MQKTLEKGTSCDEIGYVSRTESPKGQTTFTVLMVLRTLEANKFFLTTSEKGEKKNFSSLQNGPYTILENGLF